MSNPEKTPVVARLTAGSRRGRRLAGEAERLARSGLDFVKSSARRDDRVGVVTHRALELVSDGLDAAGRTLSHLGEATEPPARGQASRTEAATKKPARTRPAGTRPD
jgi:hypothetical protein